MEEREKEELEDILARIKATFTLREGALLSFWIAILFFKLSGLLYFFTKTIWVIFLLGIWIITSLAFRYLVQRQKSARGVSNFYFYYNVLIELPIMALIVYFAGGAEWMGAIFFMFPVVFTNIFFPKRRAILNCAVASIYYIILVLLPYFNLVPFSPYFPLGFNLYKNTNYIIVNILFVVFTFHLVGMVANITTDLLRKRTRELTKMKKTLEIERSNLEVKVQERTEELQKERASLEEKVKERTKELRERLEELETYHRVTIGRELKMIELKKEMEAYKKKIRESGNI